MIFKTTEFWAGGLLQVPGQPGIQSDIPLGLGEKEEEEKTISRITLFNSLNGFN